MRAFATIFSLIATLSTLGCVSSAPLPPTPIPGGIEGDLATQGFVQSADAKLRVAGRANLLVSIANVPNPPAAPPGWILVTPVFNVLAHDRQNRVIVRLPDPVSLRFDVPANRPVSVLVHDGTRWEIVPSEVDTDGRLVAQVEHLTPYAAGQPVGTPASPVPATPNAGAVSPLATLPAISLLPASAPTAPGGNSPPTVSGIFSSPVPLNGAPGGTASPVPSISSIPGVNLSPAVATVPPTSAEAALKVAIEPLKGKTERITSAAGYNGSLAVAVPPALQSALSGALSAGGTGYYGLYQTINEAVTVQGGGAVNSVLTLLVEPRTAMPSSSAEAQVQLKTAFPGVTAPLTEGQSTAGGYTYIASNDTTTYALGFISYQNVPLVYVLAGTGNYA